MDLWKGVTKDDVVITLGFDAGEYSLNLGKINAGHVWHFTDLRDAYGHKQGEFRHRVGHEYRLVRGDIGFVLEEILKRLPSALGERPEVVPAPESLNRREISRETRPGTVDAMEFYGRMHKAWRPDSIGFDDVCTAYKDRQYVAQRRARTSASSRRTTAPRWAAPSASASARRRATRRSTRSCSPATDAGVSSAARSPMPRTWTCASSS